MLSKRLSTMLLGAAAAAGVGAAANAALVIDVRAVSATGGAVVQNAKTVDVTNAGPGAVINFEVFALVSGQDGDTANDGIISFAGSFLSGTGTVARGNMTAARDAQMMGFGGSNGLAQDLDGDGDLDVGSNTDGSANNFFSARANSAPQPIFGQSIRVASATMTLSAVTIPGTDSLLNFRPRNATTAGSWYEDGTQITSANFSAGQAVRLTAIPEPATIGLASIAGLGLLARRRK